ncbi:MAG: ABC transporter permease [Anaerolineae bacterium]|nr:ABC transporter permease [Anaerolineae bacterium]
MNNILSLFTEEFFYATIRMASPVILAATGEVFLQRSGIINLGMESMVIYGAFFGVLGSALTGSGWMGLAAAMLAGTITGLLYGFIVITLKANQSVTGTAFNIVGIGLTSFLARVIWGIRELPVQVDTIKPWSVPILNKIPFIGHILFDHSPLVYLAYILVGVATFVIFKTTWGLKVRAVGENPRAAASIGINVYAWRYFCAILAGCLASMGGAVLSLVDLNMFVDGMSGGRGYFALATVILGRWHPVGAAIGGLVFGAGNALQMRMQAFGVKIPSDLLLILPFVLAFLAVVIFHGKSSAKPAALAKPYEKEATI